MDQKKAPQSWSDLDLATKIAAVKSALEVKRGNVTHAAVELGVSRATLSSFLSKHREKVLPGVIYCGQCGAKNAIPSSS